MVASGPEALARFVITYGMAVKTEYCVFTVPPGQRPAKLVQCFRTKKAAQRYARRERYLQIIPRAAKGAAR